MTLTSAGTAATAGVTGSPYAITASNATGGTFNAANYAITYAGGQLTVDPAALTVTASNATKTYGQVASLTAFTPSGLQNAETIGAVTLTSAGTAAAAGVSGSPYAINASNATGGTFNAANYAITYARGQLTVMPAAGNQNELAITNVVVDNFDSTVNEVLNSQSNRFVSSTTVSANNSKKFAACSPGGAQKATGSEGGSIIMAPGSICGGQ